MVMPSGKDLHYSRDAVIQELRMCGMPDLADRAARELSENVDGDELFAWTERNGVSKDDLINRMGGSP